MTGFAVVAFGFAVLLVVVGVMGNLRRYSRLSLRNAGDEGGRDRPGPGFTVQRTFPFVVAAGMVVIGIMTLNLADDSSWSKGELRRAVREAASALGEKPHVEEPGDYAVLIQDEVGKAGEGSGPRYSVHVKGAHTGEDEYEITAKGAQTTFCMRISHTKSNQSVKPLPGGSGISLPEYDLKAVVREGRC